MPAEPVMRQHPGGGLVLQRPRRELEQLPQLLGRQQRVGIGRSPLGLDACERRQRGEALDDLVRQDDTHDPTGISGLHASSHPPSDQRDAHGVGRRRVFPA